MPRTLRHGAVVEAPVGRRGLGRAAGVGARAHGHGILPAVIREWEERGKADESAYHPTNHARPTTVVTPFPLLSYLWSALSFTGPTLMGRSANGTPPSCVMTVCASSTLSKVAKAKPREVPCHTCALGWLVRHGEPSQGKASQAKVGQNKQDNAKEKGR